MNLDNEGAAATYARPNPHKDQRQPQKITVQTFSNKQMEQCDGEEAKGILPCGSREQTPLTTESQTTDYIAEKSFFYGNPFVEVTKGIIHIYKKK